MPREETGAFLGTTQEWDVSEIYSTEVTSPEFKELLVRLYQNLNNMALMINIKDTGYYDTSEFVTGQQFFPSTVDVDSTATASAPFRQVYRKVINFGALPNTAAKNVAHGITCNTSTQFTRIYGVANKLAAPLSYLPIPYTAALAVNMIELSVDATNVTITTGINRAAYTNCYVVVEFLKF